MSPGFLGYSDRISVLPGEAVEFKISTDLDRFDATLVELRGATWREDRQDLETEAVAGVSKTPHRGRKQPLRTGSYGRVEDDGGLNLTEKASLRVFVMPTLLDERPTAILSRWDEATGVGWWLGIEGGQVVVRLSDRSATAEARSPQALSSHTWHCVGAAWDVENGSVEVAVKGVATATNSRRSPLCEPAATEVGRGAAVRPGVASAPTCIAAHWRGDSDGPAGHFNGKIERPTIWSVALDPAELSRGADPEAAPLADWDLSAAITASGVPSDRCADAGPNGFDAHLVGQPARAVTGIAWTGAETNFTHAPKQYGAIHFHEDDIEDAGWETDVRIQVPETAKSGIYALHVSSGASEDYFPIWVGADPEAEHAPVLLVFPTSTYMAYANDREGAEGDIAEAIVAHTYVLTESDLKVAGTPGLGFSLYDSHSDGSGVGYSSRLRPIPNMRPQVRHPSGSVWGLPADMHIVSWLSHLGIPFEVATDEHLEREGAELLNRHKVVITGTHPEYCSGTSLDAFEGFIGAGGRVMYMGGNGFYWVAIPHPDKPHLLEVRRGNGGTRAWESAPGETHHAFSGEQGGLWRHRGRAPQKLFGVGFAGEGFDRSSSYRTLADWNDPALEWAVAGLEDASTLGDYGVVGGAAAGHELDRYDLEHGTPLHTAVLATSAGNHSDNYTRAVEEIGINRGGMTGAEDPQVRADVTFYETPAGGAVFATGSIAWCGSLSHNNYENDISRLTRNVLVRFLEHF
jgi:N,N-dimethylformamidase